MKKVENKIEKVKSEKAIVGNDINSLVKLAIEKGGQVEQLKELVNMKYRHEEREAKKLFHKHFCEMQAAFPIVKKTKRVENNNKKLLYSYAPLESIIDQLKGVIAKNGFSYSWTEAFPEKNIKRITINVTGYEHTESCFIDLPIMGHNSLINDIQQSGSSTTYGKRYTFLNIFGIMAEDDDDGRSVQNQQSSTNNESKNEPPTLDSICPFKKHKGKKYKNVPVDYLEWIVKNVDKLEHIDAFNKMIESKKNPIKNVTQDKRKEYTDNILENLKILEVKTTKEAEEKTGLNNDDFKNAPEDILKEIDKKIRDEVIAKKGKFEAPLEDNKLSFPDTKNITPENKDDDIFEEK